MSRTVQSFMQQLFGGVFSEDDVVLLWDTIRKNTAYFSQPLFDSAYPELVYLSLTGQLHFAKCLELLYGPSIFRLTSAKPIDVNTITIPQKVPLPCHPGSSLLPTVWDGEGLPKGPPVTLVCFVCASLSTYFFFIAEGVVHFTVYPRRDRRQSLGMDNAV